MSNQLGRISGPLLKDNLLRDGVDLAFESDLLYFDAINHRIGVGTSSPLRNLNNQYTTKTDYLIVDNQATIGNILLQTSSEISSVVGNIYFHNHVFIPRTQISSIEINDNRITTHTTNTDLELEASSTGKIQLQKNVDITGNLYITENINVEGNIIIGGNTNIGNNINDNIIIQGEMDSDIIPNIDVIYKLGSLDARWKDVYIGITEVGRIEINTNYMSVNNELLEFYGNSVGGVVLENTRFVDSTIQSFLTDQNIEIALNGTSILDINTNTAIKLALGTSLNRPTSNMMLGESRFNSSENVFEGFTTARITFGGIFSENRLTYARAEPTSNIINFVTQSTNTLEIDSTRFNVSGLLVDSVYFNNNTISTNNIDLNLIPDSGYLNLENFRIENNVILNNVNDSNTTLSHTGTGYLKIMGTTGFRIPAGTDAERPIVPEDGTLRWSDTQNYLEVYMNTQWGMANGPGGFATPEEIDEISNLYNLILG